MTSETQASPRQSLIQPPSLIRSLLSFKRGKNLATALIVFAILTVLFLVATSIYEQYVMQQTRETVSHDLAKYKVTLRSALDTRLATLDGLAAFVTAETPANTSGAANINDATEEAAFMADAISYAQSVAQNKSLGVQTLALQHLGSPWLIHPALSPTDTTYKALASLVPVSATTQAGKVGIEPVHLSTPFKIAPGQLGLVAYRPIIKNNQVWGVAAIVMDAEQILAASGVVDNDRVQRVTGLQDPNGQWLYGNADSLQNTPILVQIAVPNGNWQLVGQPSDALLATNQSHISLIRIIALVIAFLSSKLVLLALVRQTRLESIVDDRVHELAQVNTALARDVAERTRAEERLRESQAQNQALLAAIPDLMFRIDRDSRFIGYQVRDETDLYIPSDQFLNKRLDEVLPPDISEKFLVAARRALETGTVQVIEYDLTLPDKASGVRYFESRVCAVSPYETLSLVRDITERKLAYQNLEQRVSERTRELTALLKVSRQMVSTLELRPLLSLVLDHTAELLGYDLAAILVPQDNHFVYLDYRGLNTTEELIGTEAHPGVVFAVQEVIAEHNAGFVDDLFGEGSEAQKYISRLPPQVLQHITGLHAALGVPMEVKDRVIGVMLLMHRQPGHYTEAHVKLATGLADQAAVAMENARLYEQAQGIAVVEERQRLARDLHDAVTQTLFSASLIAEVLPKIWHRDRDETERRLEELRWFTRGALAEMRMLLLELRPTGLINATLGELLRQLADAATARTRFPILLQVQSNATLPSNVQIAFYRIAQESLNNVWKHAEASHVRVNLVLTTVDVPTMPQQGPQPAPYRNGNGIGSHAHHAVGNGNGGSANGAQNAPTAPLPNLVAEQPNTDSASVGQARYARLEIHDDGVGFRPEHVPSSHLGLAIMHERAADIQADLTITTAPGQGTTVTLVWHCPIANGAISTFSTYSTPQNGSLQNSSSQMS